MTSSRAPTTVVMKASFAGPRSAVCRPITHALHPCGAQWNPPDGKNRLNTQVSNLVTECRRMPARLIMLVAG